MWCYFFGRRRALLTGICPQVRIHGQGTKKSEERVEYATHFNFLEVVLAINAQKPTHTKNSLLVQGPNLIKQDDFCQCMCSADIWEDYYCQGMATGMPIKDFWKEGECGLHCNVMIGFFFPSLSIASTFFMVLFQRIMRFSFSPGCYKTEKMSPFYLGFPFYLFEMALSM